MPSFRNLLNQFHKVRANPKSSIAQRINPDIPLVKPEDLNYLAKSLKSVLNFGSTGSVGSMMGPSGLQLRSGPTGGAAAETGYFAVMRGYGTGGGLPSDKLERFIQVQRLYTTDTNPWDHRWKIDLEEVMQPVSCYPGLRAEHYALWITRATDFDNDLIMLHTPVLDIQMRSGVWVALPEFKYDLPTVETNPQYLISDCNTVAQP
jgi:hypothetical protein